MRGALVERLGESPVVREVDDPVRGDGQVLVEVTAAPVNPVDLSTGSGAFYGASPEPPYVPGVEGFGRVLEADDLDAGTRVYVESGGGRGGPGSFCERIAVDRSAVIDVPEGADDALAACLGVAGLAAWMPLAWRAPLAGGETVLVLGASGAVGQIAVQAARLLGAGRVIAAARDARGLERAHELGAEATVDLSGGKTSDELAGALRAAAGGDGVEVTVDPLWGDPAVAAAKASAGGGRIVNIGQSAGAAATLPSATVRGKGLSILGYSNFEVPWGARIEAYRSMVGHAAAGRLTVAHEVVPLERVAEAWHAQAASPGRKLVLRP